MLLCDKSGDGVLQQDEFFSFFKAILESAVRHCCTIKLQSLVRIKLARNLVRRRKDAARTAALATSSSKPRNGHGNGNGIQYWEPVEIKPPPNTCGPPTKSAIDSRRDTSPLHMKKSPSTSSMRSSKDSFASSSANPHLGFFAASGLRCSGANPHLKLRLHSGHSPAEKRVSWGSTPRKEPGMLEPGFDLGELLFGWMRSLGCAQGRKG